MTKEECAIVTLYTGVSMLEGDDLEYLYKYAEKLMERPVYTHELAALADELKERAKPDFIHLCRLASAQPKPDINTMPEQTKSDGLGVKTGKTCTDTISRQAAIDIERNATVDTNPSHFEAHQKFTQFMDDAEISSFGRWQWSNGFNTALTAVGIDLKKLPSAQPETCEGCKHLGKWENEVEYGYPSPCTRCKRRVEDHYER